MKSTTTKEGAKMGTRVLPGSGANGAVATHIFVAEGYEIKADQEAVEDFQRQQRLEALRQERLNLGSIGR